MNSSVLDFFKFASRMPQTARIVVSTFKIFRGSMPPDPPRNFLFFFHEQFQALQTKKERKKERGKKERTNERKKNV